MKDYNAYILEYITKTLIPGLWFLFVSYDLYTGALAVAGSYILGHGFSL